ncbi:hypothetical protein [Cupriavidus basilensis]
MTDKVGRDVPLYKTNVARFSSLAMELRICQKCAEESMDATGTVVWDREAAVIANVVCEKHGCPYASKCDKCGNGFKLETFGGRPRPNCPCGGKMTSDVEEGLIGVAKLLADDVHSIFEGALRGISSEALLTLMRKSARDMGMAGNSTGHLCKKLLDEACLYDFVCQKLDARGCTSITLQETMAGRWFSINPMMNIIALQVMLGPINTIKGIVEDNFCHLAAIEEFQEPVSLAAKNLMIAISESCPNIYPWMFQQRFTGAYQSLLAHEPEFVMEVMDRHKEKSMEDRRDVKDEALLKKLRERLEELNPTTVRISAHTLLAGIARGVIMRGNYIRRYPKSIEFIKNNEETGMDGVRRRLKRFAMHHPDCLDDVLINVLDYKFYDLSKNTLLSYLKKLKERIEIKIGG